MTTSFDEELKLIGLAIIAAQRVEFLLYGIASHVSEQEEDKRFQALTPESFLRGDISKLKATLGQLVKAFGNTLLIKTPELVQFYEDRNLIAHDYNRVFRIDIRGAQRRTDGIEFLLHFIERSQYWEGVLLGLVHESRLKVATKLGRQSEVVFTDTETEQIRAFHDHVGKYIASR